MNFHLVLMSGNNPGKIAVFEQSAVVLGSDPSCDLRLSPETWPAMPAQFAQIIEREQGDTNVFGLQYLVDESSPSFGTIALNNELLVRGGAALTDATVIRFGDDGPVVRFRIGLPSLTGETATTITEPPQPQETAAARPAEPAAQFTMISGNNSGKVFALVNDKPQRVGRNVGMEVALDANDVLVSGRHAVIEFNEGEWQITDTSRFGTFVNGNSIGTAILNNGDIISLGKHGPQARFQCTATPLTVVTDKRGAITPPHTHGAPATHGLRGAGHTTQTPHPPATAGTSSGRKRMRIRLVLVVTMGLLVTAIAVVGGFFVYKKIVKAKANKPATQVATVTKTPTPKPALPDAPTGLPQPDAPTPTPIVKTPTPTPRVTPTKPPTPTPSVTPLVVAPEASVPPPTPPPATSNAPSLADAQMQLLLKLPDNKWSWKKDTTTPVPDGKPALYIITAPSGLNLRLTLDTDTKPIAQRIEELEVSRAAQSAVFVKNKSSVYYQRGTQHSYLGFIPRADGTKFVVNVVSDSRALNSAESKEFETLARLLEKQ